MNSEEIRKKAIECTEYMISVMQAYKDGKEIEMCYKASDAWGTTWYPTWNWDCFDYRIKPKPKKDYTYEDGTPCGKKVEE